MQSSISFLHNFLHENIHVDNEQSNTAQQHHHFTRYKKATTTSS